MCSLFSKKGKIAFILYLASLVFVVAFGALYFVPLTGGEAWIYLTFICVVFSFAAAGAYFGETVGQKIGLTLLFSAMFGGCIFFVYDKYTLGPQRIAQRIDLLIEQMEDPDENVRYRAINDLRNELGHISDSDRQRVTEAIIDALNDEDASVQRCAVVALEEIGDPTAVKALIETLNDETFSVRGRAAEALGEIGDPTAVEALIFYLENDKYASGAIEALGKIGDERAIPVLAPRLLNYSRSKTLANALEQIGWQPESEEERVRFYVAKENTVELLGIWDQTKRVLLEDLETNKPSCVKYAVCVFLALGNEEIIPVLVDNLNESDNKDIAEIYLNCGHDELENAAEQWAYAHGYTITHRPGSTPAEWGSW